MKAEFLTYIFGTTGYIAYLAAGIFVLFGLIIKWYVQIKRGVKLSTASPDKFSWKYFFKNNLFTKLFSILANIVIAFIALRFSQEIFNVPFSMAFACGVGVAFDFIIDKVSKWQGGLKP